MRVLQAMAGGEVGGAEEFFMRLVLALHRAGLDQRVAIRHHPRRSAALAEGGLAPVELSYGGLLDWRTPRRLAAEIASYDPDIVLSWMSRAARHVGRVKKRRFVHAARLGGYYDLKYYRRCDHLIGNTEDIVRHIVEGGWPRERAHYLPNFVDAAPAPPLPRAALETPEDAPLLLALGRLHPNKAFDVLVAALADLPGVFLWLAGEGVGHAALLAEAERLGVADRVRFLGWRNDVPALLAAADMLVCPSRLEPLGNVVIEGWAHRRPVVATRSAGPSSLIADGRTGLLVPIDDAGALAAAIRRVIENPELTDDLAAAGRAAYEDRFTEQAVVAAYLDFFDRIAP